MILGLSARVDYARLGWSVEAFTEVRDAGSTKVAEIVRVATTEPEVQAVYTTAGDPDALVHVRGRDLAHVQDIIDRLRGAGPVIGTKTLMVLGRWARS